MANELMVPVGADVSKLKDNLAEGGRAVEQFEGQVKDATKATQDLGSKGQKSTRDLISEIAKMSGAERSIENYRRQLGQMTKDIQDLTVNYRNLSKEQQNSDVGKQTLQRIQELTQKASAYKDAIMDAQQAIRVAASDTMYWDAAKQGIQALSGALQGLAAAGILSAESQEDLVAVIANLKAIEAATNAVIQIGTALQKQSALMTGIAAVQSKALAKAKTLEAAATGKASLAQKVFNAVALLNPYVLLATAIIAVVGALAAFTLHSNKAKEAEEAAQKAHEDYMDSMSDSISKMGDAAYTFDTLVKKYKACRTEAEKQQFLKDYKSKLDDLGISVNDINGLEQVFINKTEDFRKACILRAQAMGLETMQADSYKQMMSEIIKARDLAAETGGNTRVNEGTPLFDMLKEYGVYDKYVSRWGKDYVVTTNDVLNDLEAAIRKKFAQTSQEIADEQKALEDQVKDLDLGDVFNFSGKGSSGTTTPTTTGGSKVKPERIADDGTKKQLQEQLSLLQQDLAYMQAGTDEWKNQLAEIEKVKAQLKEITDAEEAFTNRLNNPIEPIELPVMPKIEGKVEYQEKLQVKPVMSPADLKEEYETAAKLAGDLSEYVRLGVMDKSKAEAMLANVNETLASHGIKIPVELEIDEEEIESAIDNIRDKMESIADVISAPIHAIDSVKNAFESMQETLEDPDADAWDKFFGVFQTGEAIIGAVSTALAIFKTIQELLNKSKEKGTQETIKEMGVEAASIGVKGAVASAAITEAAAEGTVAGAQSAKSVASIPIAGPALAVAAIIAVMAAIVGMIAMAKGFATGGVVGGHSYSGDKILTRLNSGELILNKKQQDDMLQQLDAPYVDSTNTISIPSRIELVADGDNLVAAIDTYYKKNSKI